MSSALADEAPTTVLEPFPEAHEAEQEAIKASRTISPEVLNLDCTECNAEQLPATESCMAESRSRGVEDSKTLLGSGFPAGAAGQRGSRPPTPGNEALADAGNCRNRLYQGALRALPLQTLYDSRILYYDAQPYDSACCSRRTCLVCRGGVTKHSASEQPESCSTDAEPAHTDPEHNAGETILERLSHKLHASGTNQ
jgi:hypothetical protein